MGEMRHRSNVVTVRRNEAHDFFRFLFADGELGVGSAAEVQVVDVAGVDERQRERIGDAALLALSDDERAVVAARPHHRLGRQARRVAHVPRLLTEIVQLQHETIASVDIKTFSVFFYF